MSAAEIRFSKAEELRVVHQPLPRHDQQEKIAGSTRYAGDLAFASMLHARLVRAPVPSAKITRRDRSAAAAVPGVVCVLFGEDVPHNIIWVDVPGQTVEVAALKASMEVLATDRVRFHGEPVALVVADSDEALTLRGTSSASGTSIVAAWTRPSLMPTSSSRARTGPRQSITPTSSQRQASAGWMTKAC